MSSQGQPRSATRLIVVKLRHRGSHSLAFNVPPVLARAHGHEAGDLYEVQVTSQEIRFRKLSALEIQTWQRIESQRRTFPAEDEDE